MSIAESSIREEFLTGLSEVQRVYLGGFLQAVFLDKLTEVPVEEDEVPAVVAVVQAFTSVAAQAMVLRVVSSGVVRAVPLEVLREFLAVCVDESALRHVFLSLPNGDQKAVLSFLYRRSREAHRVLKELVTSRVKQVGGIAVKSSAVSEAVVRREVDQILSGFLSPSVGADAIQKIVERLIATYAVDDVDRVISGVLYDFDGSCPAMKDEASFLVHLKFYGFMDGFFGMFPELGSRLFSFLDAVIVSLLALPSPVWVMTVLGQFPVSIIRMVIVQLEQGSAQREFEKRGVYSKLLGIVSKNLSLKEAARVRAALKR